MAGRPHELTPERADVIVEAIGLGLSWKAAASLAKISPATLMNWKKRGREESDGPFVELLDRVEAAQPKTAREYLDAIKDSALESTVTTEETMHPDGTVTTKTTVRPPNIKGGLWWLERRFPGEFGRKVEHSGGVTVDDKRDRVVTVNLVRSNASESDE